MTVDRRVGKKITDFYDRNKAIGVRIDPGPYEAIVKNNVDPARHGRMQVYIPELGGNDDQIGNNPDNPTYWRIVSYATPFYGEVDPGLATNTGAVDTQNVYGHTKQSYGMWFVPPDPGTKVLVTFVNGDPNRGYWFACIPDGTNHYMVPGLGASKNLVAGSTAPEAPVVEFNDADPKLAQRTDFLNNPKPVHAPQLAILTTQGLQNDTIRGVTTSSSQRDIPSTVFGISTPGRQDPDPADDPQLRQNLQNNSVDESTFNVTARKGGHTFVMDDGDPFGDSQLFRLRSATGHQLLMHDTEGLMYISNATGTVWIELTNAGNFNMFIQGDVSVHGTGNLNMQFDKNININAGQNFSVNAGGNISLQAKNLYSNVKGDTNFTSSGNAYIKSGAQFNAQTGSGVSLKSGGRIELNGATVGLNDGGGSSVPSAPLVVSGSGSVSAIVPTHEPWSRPVPAQPQSQTPSTSATLNNKKLTNDATKTVTGKGVKKMAPAAILATQNAPGAVGTLTQDQTKALMAQIGYNESGGNYGITGGSSGNYLGKYQVGAALLVQQGYISSAAYKADGNSAVFDPNAWTGKNGIGSANDYLGNPSIQDQVMYNNLTGNYSTMLNTGALQTTDDPATVGGMLQVAHLLGAGGATTWRNSGSGSDAFGTTGTTYYNQGRYAINVLANGSTASTS